MKIYLDHSATTPLSKDTLDAMIPYFTDIFGNASSQHSLGREASKAVDESRKIIAELLNCKMGEIYFTSGGTESDNWAIKSIAYANKNKGNHIITSKIEHHAVINSCKALEAEGFEVTYLDVDSQGFVSVDDLEKNIKDTTILVTIMFANNEIGSIQPIKEIGELCAKNKIYFHTDAVQAIGSVPVDVKALNIDALSLSAHKFYGPKGVGVLYRRNGIRMTKFMSGGEQERGQRAGTINTPNIVGMAKAMQIAINDMEENNNKIAKLRDYFISRVSKEISDIYFNGSRDMNKRLSNNANFSFEFIEGESILILLDMSGICVSSGSACSAGALEPSHVLLATGLPIEISHGSIRFSFGKNNTKEEVDYTVDTLKEIITKLRLMSPLFKEIEGDKFYV